MRRVVQAPRRQPRAGRRCRRAQPLVLIEQLRRRHRVGILLANGAGVRRQNHLIHAVLKGRIRIARLPTRLAAPVEHGLIVVRPLDSLPEAPRLRVELHRGRILLLGSHSELPGHVRVIRAHPLRQLGLGAYPRLGRFAVLRPPFRVIDLLPQLRRAVHDSRAVRPVYREPPAVAPRSRRCLLILRYPVVCAGLHDAPRRSGAPVHAAGLVPAAALSRSGCRNLLRGPGGLSLTGLKMIRVVEHGPVCPRASARRRGAECVPKPRRDPFQPGLLCFPPLHLRLAVLLPDVLGLVCRPVQHQGASLLQRAGLSASAE